MHRGDDPAIGRAATPRSAAAAASWVHPAGALVAGKRAVIFDMDGVLWDTAKVHSQAFAFALEPLGIPIPEYRELAGRRSDDMIISLLERAGMEATRELVADLTAVKRQRVIHLLREVKPVAEGAVEVLEHLAGRYLLALASAASPASAALFLDASGTAPLFSAILTGNDVSAGKPAPDVYLAALARLEVAAEEAVVVEDAESGIIAARGAGIPVIGLAGTVADADLRAAGAAAVITDIRQLVAEGTPAA